MQCSMGDSLRLAECCQRSQDRVTSLLAFVALAAEQIVLALEEREEGLGPSCWGEQEEQSGHRRIDQWRAEGVVGEQLAALLVLYAGMRSVQSLPSLEQQQEAILSQHLRKY